MKNEEDKLELFSIIILYHAGIIQEGLSLLFDEGIKTYNTREPN